MLTRRFFERDALVVAPSLLGCVLHCAGVDLRLTEVEAYRGADDPASHAYRGPTPRNAVMFGPAGHLYVYFTYGLHYCANLVCGLPGEPTAVLLRAGEVIAGEDVARSRRPGVAPCSALARGPANLVRTMGLGPDDNGLDVCGNGPVTVHAHRPHGGGDRLLTGPRVGVRNAAERPWRFWLADEPSVSAYRPAAPRPARPGEGRPTARR